MKKKKREKGFSLIELIIAIAILVILTGLLAPQFLKYIERSRRAVCMSGMETISEEYLVGMIEADRTADAAVSAAVLSQVMEQHRGNRDTKEDSIVYIYSGLCKSGGKYRCRFSSDLSCLEIECSKHGMWELDVVTLSALLDEMSFEEYPKLYKQYKTLGDFLKAKDGIDSEATGTDDPTLNIYAPYKSLAGIVGNELNKVGINVTNKSWKMVKKNGKNVVYLTGRKITSDDIKNKSEVECTEYDLDKKTVTHGTAAVSWGYQNKFPVVGKFTETKDE